MNNIDYINLDQLELTTQSLLRKINEQSNLKVDKDSILSNTSTGSIIASINGTDIYNGVTFDGNFENLSNIPYIVSSVNNEYGDNINVRKLQPYTISKNLSFNLIGIDFNASSTALSNIYKETSISLLENNTNSILSVGNYNTLSKGPGILQLYRGGTASNTGYIQLMPSTTGTATYTLNLPSADGTVALTSDIPNVPSWALATNKPVYTASEVGAAASNHTHTSIGESKITGSANIIATTSNININYAPEAGAQSHIKTITAGMEFYVLGHNRTDSTKITLTSTSLTGIPTPTENTSAVNKKYVDDAIAGVTDTNTTYTLSMSGNVITLTPSTGTVQTITLPVYNGGVTP